MRVPHRLPRRVTRPVLASVALLAQLVAALGAPALSPRAAAGSAQIPFPCQSRPCGCGTSEQGWAGDCCCFTLEQKLAWAEARGIEPPPHVRAAVGARRAAVARAPRPPCCAPPAPANGDATAASPRPHRTGGSSASPAPAVRWVATASAQKCRGEGPAGPLKLDAGPAPDRPGRPHADRPVRDFAPPADAHARSVPSCPPTPPPRAF